MDSDLELASLFPRPNEIINNEDGQEKQSDIPVTENAMKWSFKREWIVTIAMALILACSIISITVIAVYLTETMSNNKLLGQKYFELDSRLAECIESAGKKERLSVSSNGEKGTKDEVTKYTKPQKIEPRPLAPKDRSTSKGSKGEKGMPGRHGIPGLPGFKGVSGPKGSKGDKGNPGNDGTTGDKGSNGLPGSPGPRGYEGRPGLNGLIGEPGVKGEIGKDGVKGEIGPLGPKGTSGNQGQKGDKGQSGKAGVLGGKGDKGDPGEKGGLVSCDAGWIDFGRSCYFFEFKMKKNFQQAQDDCIARRASLTKIDNMVENWFLKSLVKEGNTENVYFGLHDRGREGKFIWVSDNSPLAFSDWAPGQPDNSRNKEDCGHFWNRVDYRWNDVTCDRSYGYICEKILG